MSSSGRELKQLARSESVTSRGKTALLKPCIHFILSSVM
jgi:hypothetical protein